MKRTHLLYKFSVAALAPVLALAIGASAYAQDHDRDNHQSGQRDDRNYQGNDNQRSYQGNDSQRSNQGNYQQRNDDRHYNQGNGYGNQGNGYGRDFHFDNSHRDRFEQHYRRDADRWRDRHDRARFAPGQRIPSGYRIQPVPLSYYRGAPPPPRGYRYGYYQGYVVAYDPTTRMIGDVLDLIGAAATSR